MFEEEVTVRDGLNAQMSSHFLSRLFPGLNEFPPEFATSSPEEFDQYLPRISWSDVQRIKEALPPSVAWSCPDVISVTLPKLVLETVSLLDQPTEVRFFHVLESDKKDLWYADMSINKQSQFILMQYSTFFTR